MNPTPALAAAGLYAALASFIFIQLASATGKLRRAHKVSIGDAGVPQLVRVLRGTANATENIPVFLVMLVTAALLGAPTVAIHVLGLPFVIFRAIHAWHFIQEDAPGWQRALGYGIPFLCSLLLALGLVGHALWTMFF